MLIGLWYSSRRLIPLVRTKTLRAMVALKAECRSSTLRAHLLQQDYCDRRDGRDDRVGPVHCATQLSLNVVHSARHFERLAARHVVRPVVRLLLCQFLAPLLGNDIFWCTACRIDWWCNRKQCARRPVGPWRPPVELSHETAIVKSMKSF